MAAEGDWRYALDRPLPRELRVGGGSALFLSGWAFHRHEPTRELTLRLGGRSRPVPIHSMPRLDVYVAVAEPGDRPPTRAYLSGFWAVLPLPGVQTPLETDLVLEAVSGSGERLATPLATLRLLPTAAPPAVPPEPGLVAICMATHNPDLELFRRQVASLRAQTHEQWRCVVSDDASEPEAYAAIELELGGDERFELHRNDERLGFYFNFERALELAPPEAEAVALCDQDDAWRADKLATLLAALRGSRTLVYSDQRIVGRDGDVLAPSYWVERENQWTDLRALAVANTVTGAASLFRRDLLDVLLPFPPRLGGAYHDHWLALAARVRGEIAYVDEPLYDYVQHAGQVLGHPAGKREAGPPPPRLPLAQRWQLAYFARVVPPQFAATALLERCGEELAPKDRATLVALADGDTSLRGLREHAAAIRALRETDPENGALAALTGAAWRRWSRWRGGRSDVPLADGRHSLDGRADYVEYPPEPADAVQEEPGPAPRRTLRRRRTV